MLEPCSTKLIVVYLYHSEMVQFPYENLLKSIEGFSSIHLWNERHHCHFSWSNSNTCSHTITFFNVFFRGSNNNTLLCLANLVIIINLQYNLVEGCSNYLMMWLYYLYEFPVNINTKIFYQFRNQDNVWDLVLCQPFCFLPCSFIT